jgi:hypothetical protein
MSVTERARPSCTERAVRPLGRLRGRRALRFVAVARSLGGDFTDGARHSPRRPGRPSVARQRANVRPRRHARTPRTNHACRPRPRARTYRPDDRLRRVLTVEMDDEEQPARLLLPGKGVVLTHRLARPLAAESDDLRARRPARRGRPQSLDEAGTSRSAARTPPARPGRASARCEPRRSLVAMSGNVTPTTSEQVQVSL